MNRYNSSDSKLIFMLTFFEKSGFLKKRGLTVRQILSIHYSKPMKDFCFVERFFSQPSKAYKISKTVSVATFELKTMFRWRKSDNLSEMELGSKKCAHTKKRNVSAVVE